MIMQVLHCPYCQGTDIIRHGTSRQGKQRYRCQENACKGRTFLLDYTYPGHFAGVKQQIIDMAMNASGIRDTSRAPVTHHCPQSTEKKEPDLQPGFMRCWRSSSEQSGEIWPRITGGASVLAPSSTKCEFLCKRIASIWSGTPYHHTGGVAYVFLVGGRTLSS